MASTRHPTDWERQREQLSAYLDGELSPAERAALERHLPTCAQCQTELAALRRVRATLAALPSPALPRSFALPRSVALPTGAPGTTRATGLTTGTDGRSRRDVAAQVAADRPGWYRASQWVGGIAASIGLVLLLGSALLGSLGGHPYAATSASGQAPAISAAQTTRTPMDARSSPPTQGQASGTAPTTPTEVTPTPRTTVSSGPPPSGGAELPIGPLSGAGLLAGGLALVVVGRVAKRRR